MRSCKNQDVLAYWSENMRQLGWDIPSTFFASTDQLLTHIGFLVGLKEVVGPKTLVKEIFSKMSGGNRIIVVGSARAMFYIGSAIGSLAVARGREMACGATIADALWEIRQNGITAPPWLRQHLTDHPEILARKNSASGKIYYQKALN